MKVFFGARLFDGERLLDDHALVVEDGVDPRARRRRASGRAAASRSICGGGILAPGLDRLADQRRRRRPVQRRADRRGDRRDRRARTGARASPGFLPTVVTDAPEVLAAALAAAREAQGRVPGALGIHVEGPFIDPRRTGVHPPQWIRPMREADAEALIEARAGVMVVTLAPASVPLALVARLAKRGIVVSLGHSEATRGGGRRRVRRRRAGGHPSLQRHEPAVLARAGRRRRGACRSPRRLRPDRGRRARPSRGLPRGDRRQGRARDRARLGRHAARRRRPGLFRVAGPHG